MARLMTVSSVMIRAIVAICQKKKKINIDEACLAFIFAYMHSRSLSLSLLCLDIYYDFIIMHFYKKYSFAVSSLLEKIIIIIFFLFLKVF